MTKFWIVLILGLSAIPRQNIEAETKQILFDNDKGQSKATTCNNSVNGIHSFTIPAESPNGPITLMHILYDASRAIPVTSTTYHDSMNKNQAVTREDNFRPWDCPQLEVPTIQPDCRKTFKMTTEQQELSGYTSFDRGHLSPVNPYRFDFTAMDNTFYCVNIAPQEPFTNQNPWSDIEQTVLYRTTAGYVMTGLCSEDSQDGVTLDEVRVPSCWWKLLCYKQDSETYVVGFIGENSLYDRYNLTLEEIRANATKEPRSQSEVISRYGGDVNLIRQAWLESSTVLLTNREAELAPSPQSCIDRLDLPVDIEDDWRTFIQEVSLEIENDKYIHK